MIRSGKSRERREQFIMEYRHFHWDGVDRGLTKQIVCVARAESNFSFSRNSAVTLVIHIARD